MGGERQEEILKIIRGEWEPGRENPAPYLRSSGLVVLNVPAKE
jgi:hypothetical protein